jgi:hypothetical protein
VVLLDGLDQLAEGSHADHLRWLPAGARLVVSTRPGEAAARLLSRHPDALTLRPMPPADGGRLLDAWLAAAGRTLHWHGTGHPGRPRQLRLGVRGEPGGGLDRLRKLGRAVVPEPRHQGDRDPGAVGAAMKFPTLVPDGTIGA